MPYDEALKPASRTDLVQSIAYALRHDGRRRAHDADDWMARVAAERLVAHLEQSRFVVMQRPPAQAHGDPRFTKPAQE